MATPIPQPRIGQMAQNCLEPPNMFRAMKKGPSLGKSENGVENRAFFAEGFSSYLGFVCEPYFQDSGFEVVPEGEAI